MGTHIIQLIVLLILCYVESITAILTCLIVAVGIGGFSSLRLTSRGQKRLKKNLTQSFEPLMAYSVNFLDLAPQYGSITVGISNTIATFPGAVIPYITGHIVQNSVMFNLMKLMN